MPIEPLRRFRIECESCSSAIVIEVPDSVSPGGTLRRLEHEADQAGWQILGNHDNEAYCPEHRDRYLCQVVA